MQLPLRIGRLRSLELVYELGVDEVADFETGVFDHLLVGVKVLAAGGEVSVGEHGVGRVEREWLEAAQAGLAPAGDADLGVGQDKPEHGQRAQAVVRRKAFLAFEVGALARVEKVDRRGVGFQFLEHKPEIDAVFEAFAHTDQAAATEIQPDLFDGSGGFDAIFKLVRGADGGIKVGGGFEVVVETVDAGVLQALCLFFGQKAHGGAEFELRILRLYFRGGLGDDLHFTFGRRARAGDDAVAQGLHVDRTLGPGDDFVGRLHRIFLHIGGGGFRLATERAIFRAGPALGVFQHVQADLFPEEILTDQIGRLQDVEQLIVRRLQHRQRLFAGNRLPAIQNPVCQRLPIHDCIPRLLSERRIISPAPGEVNTDRA